MSSLIKIPSFKLAVYIRGEKNAEKLALVLPGRVDTKDYPHMQSHVNFLASKGYLALSFDPPGTWESPGDIKKYTITNYLKAINELIEHFGNRPTVLMGHSRGGSMAMLAGTLNSHVTHIITAMSQAGPSRISKKDKRAGVEISFRDTPTGEKRKFELPLSYFEDGKKYNAIKALSKCTKPKLYIIGTKDDDITPEFAKPVYTKSAEPKQLYEVNSEHDYRLHPEIIQEINKVMGEFLTRKV